MIRAPRVHWLRGNRGERTPTRLMVLDTESRVIQTQPREVQALRCWALNVIERTDPEREHPLISTTLGTDPEAMLQAILGPIKAKTSWRLFTHNLSYDLGLTRLPLALLGAGWEVGRHNLASDQPWAYFKRGGRGLWLCDSWSWLPQPLEKLGETLGLAKPPLPHPDDPEAAWLARCRADVEITTVALLRLLDEWDRRRLGWWSITGPASGWNTFLHFPARSGAEPEGPRAHRSDNPHASAGAGRVLVVPDPEARKFERSALYSGRRDVWKTGQLDGGPWAEIDLKQAHLTICAYLPLPYRRWASFRSLDLDDWRLEADGAGLVAQVVVRCHAPRYPLRHAGAVLHPIGEFATVLAGPEIREAKARGELVSVGRGYGYHLGHTMRDWAQWCLAVLADDGSEVEPMLQVAVKGWSRSVPGRWGMTHSREIKSGPSHVDAWSLEPITVGSPPQRGSIFHFGGRWAESLADQEADDSFPAVLAYVQSYCRLALNRILDALPESALVSCNTEGAWVDVAGLDILGHRDREAAGRSRSPQELAAAGIASLNIETSPLEVRIKQTARQLKVLSPQHHATDQARLYSGVPRSAEDLGGERYHFQTWPKLRGQIEKGDPRGYVREHRTVNLSGLPVSRWAFQDGACESVEARHDPERGTWLLPPSAELLARHGALRAVQHPVLRRVLQQWGGGVSDAGPG